MSWTVESFRRARDHADERALFEAKRRERMDEREASARLYRLPGSNVVVLPQRPPVDVPPDRAA